MVRIADLPDITSTICCRRTYIARNKINLNDVYKTLCPQHMLVHKGGQINNVQLITGVRIAEMSQLQNCSVMCTKNGSYCENEKREKSQGEGGGSG